MADPESITVELHRRGTEYFGQVEKIAMTTAELASALIQVFEGLRLKAYQDSGGVWTIGYGHTRTAKPGMVITLEQAVALFEKDCAPLLKMVADKPVIEGAALVSFGYNCGAGALGKLLRGELDMMDKTRDRKGKVQPGLVSRRRLEAALIQASRG